MSDVLVFDIAADEAAEPTRVTVDLAPDVLVFDEPIVTEITDAAQEDFLLFDAPPAEVAVVTAPQDFLLIDEPSPSPAVASVETGEDFLLITSSGPPGIQGPPGANGDPFEYQMPTAQTTALVDHTLGYDPVAVQVFDEDGVLCSEYSVVFTIPAAQVRVGFDISIKALIRLI